MFHQTNAGAWISACLALILLGSQAQAVGPIFHLDFDGDFSDKSPSGLTTQVGSAVLLNPGGGPTLSGGVVNAATFAGDDDVTENGSGVIKNEIKIPDNAALDSVSNGAGSVVTWIKTAKDFQWNNILVDLNFGMLNGIELQATYGWAGVFGSASGFETTGTSVSEDHDFGEVSYSTGNAFSQLNVPVNRADPDDEIDT